MTAEEYLTAFDDWQTRRLDAAVKAGKDFAFRERRTNQSFELDTDGSGWDHILLDPGEAAPGRAWTVYRLQGVAPSPPAPPRGPASAQPQPHAMGFAALVRAVFGASMKPPLRLVSSSRG